MELDFTVQIIAYFKKSPYPRLDLFLRANFYQTVIIGKMNATFRILPSPFSPCTCTRRPTYCGRAPSRPNQSGRGRGEVQSFKHSQLPVTWTGPRFMAVRASCQNIGARRREKKKQKQNRRNIPTDVRHFQRFLSRRFRVAIFGADFPAVFPRGRQSAKW